MHAGMDEPELLMELLSHIAADKVREGGRTDAWAIVGEHALSCVAALEKANETPRR
jgi:hypothetical protein